VQLPAAEHAEEYLQGRLNGKRRSEAVQVPATNLEQ
jgi:hypothetical protein